MVLFWLFFVLVLSEAVLVLDRSCDRAIVSFHPVQRAAPAGI
jgi:hypothetical protein